MYEDCNLKISLIINENGFPCIIICPTVHLTSVTTFFGNYKVLMSKLVIAVQIKNDFLMK